jgi:hypothetical protein
VSAAVSTYRTDRRAAFLGRELEEWLVLRSAATRMFDASSSGGNAIKTSFSMDDSDVIADIVIEDVRRRLYATNARARRRCKLLIRLYVRVKT